MSVNNNQLLAALREVRRDHFMKNAMGLPGQFLALAADPEVKAAGLSVEMSNLADLAFSLLAGRAGLPHAKAMRPGGFRYETKLGGPPEPLTDAQRRKLSHTFSDLLAALR